MARLARLYAPDIPQLIQARFVEPLAQPVDPSPVEPLNQLAVWLRECAHEQHVNVHGWVLLYDRMVLLATPSSRTGIARLMQAIGRRFTSRLSSGRVFEGRYRSALLQPEHWVLPALVWLDILPVQHGYVEQAESWPWSSACYHTGLNLKPHTWANEHPDYWQLGNTPFDRQAVYRKRLAHGLDTSQRQRLEAALFGQWALGDEHFLQAIGAHATRRVAPAPRGRPRKHPKNTSHTNPD
ncbi:MAG: hypothetical protein GX086_06050 [Alcaligenaceae bacterium]|jgi:putative transposase|nr:hypothetical protein [Alcaligenaceae bacterium]